MISFRDILYRLEKAGAGLLFPYCRCLCCGAPVAGELLCPACGEKRRALRSCPSCASFISSTETEHYLCRSCRMDPPVFTAAAAALPYEGEFRSLLLSFKYHGETGLRRPLAELMATLCRERFSAVAFDGIVPVPAHKERLAERGYDQAVLLGRLLAKEIGVPCREDILRRQKKTPPLAGLNRREREKVMKDAFLAADCRGMTLLLADDIFTTGATADAAARELMKKGAAAVYVLTAAAGRDL